MHAIYICYSISQFGKNVENYVLSVRKVNLKDFNTLFLIESLGVDHVLS